MSQAGAPREFALPLAAASASPRTLLRDSPYLSPRGAGISGSHLELFAVRVSEMRRTSALAERLRSAPALAIPAASAAPLAVSAPAASGPSASAPGPGPGAEAATPRTQSVLHEQQERICETVSHGHLSLVKEIVALLSAEPAVAVPLFCRGFAPSALRTLKVILWNDGVPAVCRDVYDELCRVEEACVLRAARPGAAVSDADRVLVLQRLAADQKRRDAGIECYSSLAEILGSSGAGGGAPPPVSGTDVGVPAPHLPSPASPAEQQRTASAGTSGTATPTTLHRHGHTHSRSSTGRKSASFVVVPPKASSPSKAAAGGTESPVSDLSFGSDGDAGGDDDDDDDDDDERARDLRASVRGRGRSQSFDHTVVVAAAAEEPEAAPSGTTAGVTAAGGGSTAAERRMLHRKWRNSTSLVEDMKHTRSVVDGVQALVSGAAGRAVDDGAGGDVSWRTRPRQYSIVRAAPRSASARPPPPPQGFARGEPEKLFAKVLSMNCIPWTSPLLVDYWTSRPLPPESYVPLTSLSASSSTSASNNSSNNSNGAVILVDLERAKTMLSVEVNSKSVTHLCAAYDAAPFVLGLEDDFPFYRDFFALCAHKNYVAAGGACVVSIQEPGDGSAGELAREQGCKAIVRVPARDYRVLLPSRNRRRALESYLPTVVTRAVLKSLKEVRPARQHDAVQRLLAYESAYIVRQYKFGLLYRRPGVQSENALFAVHGAESRAYRDFLALLGERVALRGFAGYRGGLDVREDATGTHSVYTRFKDFEIMFHVCTMLPFDPRPDAQQVERKRHIGNDVVTLVFDERRDDADRFDPTVVTSQFLLSMVFVSPVLDPATGATTHYVVNTVNKPSLDPFPPFLPEHNVFPAGPAFRNWLLHKMVNAERTSLHSRDLIAFRSSRKLHLQSICSDFA